MTEHTYSVYLAVGDPDEVNAVASGIDCGYRSHVSLSPMIVSPGW